jgi:HNH endonuclease
MAIDIVRSTKVAETVKHLHDYTCQVCGTQLITPAGPYAEAAHIRALGIPHNGPDVLDNVLCLCPNDHVRFDTGAIYVDDDYRICQSADAAPLGTLRLRRGHTPNRDYFAYHREHFATQASTSETIDTGATPHDSGDSFFEQFMERLTEYLEDGEKYGGHPQPESVKNFISTKYMPKPQGKARNDIIFLVRKHLPLISLEKLGYVVGVDKGTVSRVLRHGQGGGDRGHGGVR